MTTNDHGSPLAVVVLVAVGHGPVGLPLGVVAPAPPGPVAPDQVPPGVVALKILSGIVSLSLNLYSKFAKLPKLYPKTQ